MFDLFAIELVVKGEVLFSKDEEQFHNIEIKECSGKFPYQVSVETGSHGRIHGTQSYSYPDLEEAETQFLTVLSFFREQGFENKPDTLIN